MFLRVVRERKRREIDPTADAIREVMGKLPESDSEESVAGLRARLEALMEIFDLINIAYNQVFGAEMGVDDLRNIVRTTRASTPANKRETA